MSFPREEVTAFLVPQSWLTCLFVRHWCNFCSCIWWTSQKTFHFQLNSSSSDDDENKEKFFLHFCGTIRFGYNFHLINERNQQTAKWLFIQYCPERTNQQNWKESFESKIVSKTKNQLSCWRGCQNINLACRFSI